MDSNARALAVAALLGLLVCDPLAAPAKRKLPCDGGRFLVPRPELMGEAASPDLETIVVDESGVSISLGCPTVTPRLGAGRLGTLVGAAWRSCADVPDRNGSPARTRLVNGVIASPECDTLTGVLVVSRGRPRRRRFKAARSRCGDGVLDVAAGEQCGDGGAACPADARCTDACTC